MFLASHCKPQKNSKSYLRASHLLPLKIIIFQLNSNSSNFYSQHDADEQSQHFLLRDPLRQHQQQSGPHRLTQRGGTLRQHAPRGTQGTCKFIVWTTSTSSERACYKVASFRHRASVTHSVFHPPRCCPPSPRRKRLPLTLHR